MERFPNGQFKKGGPGRAVGSRNKLQAKVIDELAKDFEEHGAGVIRIVRMEKPVDYLRIVASILPKEFVVSEAGLDELSDAEVLEALNEIRKARAGRETTGPYNA